MKGEKNRSIFILAFIFLSFVALNYQLCSSVWAASMDIQAETKLPTLVPPTDNTAKENLTDSSFLQKAASGIFGDIELSKLALEKSQNSNLKKLAKKISDDRSSDADKLKQIASNSQLVLPQQLDSDRKQMLNQMRTLKGLEFDQTFISVMKKSLDTTVGLYDNAAGQVSLDSELRQYIVQALPKLRESQEMAHTLEHIVPATADAT